MGVHSASLAVIVEAGQARGLVDQPFLRAGRAGRCRQMSKADPWVGGKRIMLHDHLSQTSFILHSWHTYTTKKRVPGVRVVEYHEYAFCFNSRPARRMTPTRKIAGGDLRESLLSFTGTYLYSIRFRNTKFGKICEFESFESSQGWGGGGSD